MTNTTPSTKKPTKKQTFNAIISQYNLSEEHKAFLLHEIELLEKKNSSTGDKKLTPIQVANNALKTDILEYMATHPTIGKTCSMLIKEVPSLNELSNQKVTALMRALIDEGKVEKRTEKKATVFYITASAVIEVTEGE